MDKIIEKLEWDNIRKQYKLVRTTGNTMVEVIPLTNQEAIEWQKKNTNW